MIQLLSLPLLRFLTSKTGLEAMTGPDFACGIGESKKPSILAAPMLSFPKLMGLRKFE
jgi:hypothetical protein